MTRVRTFRRASESRTTTATNMSIRDLPFTLRRTFISSDDAAGARSTLFGAEWIAQLKWLPREMVRASSSLRGARMGMTTVWRPRVRIDVPNVGGAENTDTSRDELTKKGTKRKRAPKHYGPCEHGVKYRSKCKVCGACPHGRQRSQCKECGGGSICEHGRVRSICKECGGGSICEHGRVRSVCKECGGAGICEHGRQRSKCKECGGSQICEHGRVRSRCKECGGAGICEHGRQRHECKECGAK